MTILVMGHIKTAPCDAAKMTALLAEHMKTTQAEAGCELYSFAFDAADPDLLRISERWESPEALAAHGTADHQKAFGRALRGFTVLEISVKAWDGQFWRTLIGE